MHRAQGLLENVVDDLDLLLAVQVLDLSHLDAELSRQSLKLPIVLLVVDGLRSDAALEVDVKM